MPDPTFDPTLPVDGSLIVAVELRNQLNALKANADGRAPKPMSVAPMDSGFADPPTQDNLFEIQAKINELIAALKG